MTALALRLRDLTVTDPTGARLVDGISFDVPRGSVLTLIGETGSGKSLVAQAIFGLLPQTLTATGDIWIGEGDRISASNAAGLGKLWREQIMLLPQEPMEALDPTMRIGRQLELAGADAASALADVDLPTTTAALFPHMLSGGMAQRVLVATALAGNTPLLVADEPTKGLDGERIAQTIALFRSVSAAGRSLVVITHDLDVARGLPGITAVVRDGRIVEMGATTDTLGDPKTEYAKDWVAADPATWRPCRRCTAMDRMPLAAHDLAFAWPGRDPLFSGVDVHVPKGGVLALVGPSGCGKTTLGNILLGLLKPTAGHVHWHDTDPYADASGKARLRQRYQKLHQDPMTAFAPHARLEDQFVWLRQLGGGQDAMDVLPALLERLKLKTGLLARYPSEVSGGEAQRLAIARILLLNPHVIVADEPTSRLDPLIQRDTINLLRECVDERGLSLILISHDQRLVEAVADEWLRL